MSDIRRALMRKFGPLPAWAWAIIAAGALYLYRRNAALGAGQVGATGASATSPSVTDSTASRGDPTTLQPGESVYDPNTGQLLGTSDEQQPSDNGTATPTEPQMPVTLQPGESVYDPNTGKFLTGATAAAATAAATKKPATKKKVTKRTKKHKPQHSQTKSVRTDKHKTKPRGTGKLRNPLRSKQKQPTSHKPTHRRTHANTSEHGSRQRHKVTTPKAAPMRGRPAAPHTVDHGTQQVVNHPARFAPKAHQAEVTPPKKRKARKR